MKATLWILPSSALLLGGAWIAMQRNSAAELRREIIVIQERIRQSHSIAGSDTPVQTANVEKSESAEWKSLIVKMRDASGLDILDLNLVTQMKRLLKGLSAAELCEKMDEIAALDIHEQGRKELINWIMSELSEKDPKLVLARFETCLANDTNEILWTMPKALANWAEKEPAAAAAWLDEQIAAGSMESKMLNGNASPRVRFELSLMGKLLIEDPSAATLRVNGMTEWDREEFFNHMRFNYHEKNTEAAYAKLVRDTMPTEKALGILRETSATLAILGNYERVDDFINSSSANADEKQAIATGAITQRFELISGEAIANDQLEKARAWGMSHSPAAVNKATGEALARAVREGTDFGSTSALAVQYNEEAGNDETLAAFLTNEQVRSHHAQQAAALIAKIRNPALRAEISSLEEYKQPVAQP